MRKCKWIVAVIWICTLMFSGCFSALDDLIDDVEDYITESAGGEASIEEDSSVEESSMEESSIEESSTEESSTEESSAEESSAEESSVKESSIEESSQEESSTEEELTFVEERTDELYTYERMVIELNSLEILYGELIEVSSIGTSAMGRDIPLVKLGHGGNEVLYVAAVHGCEFSTVNYIMRCLWEYAETANAWEMYGEYDIARIFYDYTFYIVPMANPDGYQISNHEESPLWYNGVLTAEERHDYSCNSNGANLNRNFPFEWEWADEGTEPAIAEGKGPYGGSEPETQALMELCAEHHFQWMFSFHNYGHCVFWQDTYNGSIEGDAYLAERLEDVCGFYLPPATSDPAGYGGGFENWFRAEFGRPGFCVELGLLEYDPSVFIENFEEAVSWETTKYAMLVGTE